MEEKMLNEVVVQTLGLRIPNAEPEGPSQWEEVAKRVEQEHQAKRDGGNLFSNLLSGLMG
jgi:hypothetical protein